MPPGVITRNETNEQWTHNPSVFECVACLLVMQATVEASSVSSGVCYAVKQAEFFLNSLEKSKNMIVTVLPTLSRSLVALLQRVHDGVFSFSQWVLKGAFFAPKVCPRLSHCGLLSLRSDWWRYVVWYCDMAGCVPHHWYLLLGQAKAEEVKGARGLGGGTLVGCKVI